MGFGKIPVRTIGECEKHCSDLIDRETENQLLITQLQSQVVDLKLFIKTMTEIKNRQDASEILLGIENRKLKTQLNCSYNHNPFGVHPDGFFCNKCGFVRVPL